MHRRSLLKLLTATSTAIVAAILAIPSIRFLLRLPATRGPKGTTSYTRVTPLSALIAGSPIQLTVRAARWDSFIHHPPRAIGRVWLYCDNPTVAEPRVVCFQAICPHLGCGIDFDADRAGYVCPCHDSRFDAHGKRLNDVSPRGMDELPCRVTEADANGQRWVEVLYQEFRTGVSSKNAIS